jgi:AraC-like DNA-binding protein
MKHLTGEIEFWYYQSKPNVWHEPRTLEAGIEEIEVIVSGRGYFELADGSTVDAGPGSNLWYCPGDIVGVTSHEKEPYETIVFRFKIHSRPISPLPRYTQWQSVGECNRFSRAALALYKSQPELAPEEVYCWYARLVEEARTYMRQEKQLSLPAPLAKAMSYITENFRENISINDIAENSGVSASHLHMLFRQHIHSSPMQFVIRQRILLACELLNNHTMSVKEVCFKSGFSDVKYFISRFKAQTALTPGQYGKQVGCVQSFKKSPL